MRADSAVVVSLLLLAIGFTALQATPVVSADCHCTFIGCTSYPVTSEEDEEKDLNGNNRVDLDEMDRCAAEARIEAFRDKLAPGGVTFVGYIGAEVIGVTGGGDIEVARGTTGLLAVHFTATTANQTPTGTLHLGAAAGVSYPDGADADYDVEGDHTADIEFLVAEGAPDHIVIPYTITPAGGGAPHEGRLELTAVDDGTVATGGLTPIEIGVIGGIVGLILGALLVGVIMLAFRK